MKLILATELILLKWMDLKHTPLSIVCIDYGQW